MTTATTEVRPEVERVATEYEVRVGRGAMALDMEVPGWADKIDLDRLDLWFCNRCVLGQLYGLYTKGLRAVCGIDFDERDPPLGAQLWAHDHGFYEMDAIADYRHLRPHWEAAIRARRGARP
jgi:hypothetical protein